VGFVDIADKAREQAKGCEHEGWETDILADSSSRVEANVCGFAYGCELQCWTDYACETEDDEEVPTGTSAETMANGEENRNEKCWDVDDDLANGDSVVVSESHVVCVTGSDEVLMIDNCLVVKYKLWRCANDEMQMW